MAASDGMYFATQKFTDTNCVTLAINNLFGEPIVTRDSLLDMKIKNKKNRHVHACEEHNLGISCQNQVIRHLLKLIQTEKLTVSKPVRTFFENTSAGPWYDLSVSRKIDANKFDTFFNLFEDYIVGIFGNRSIYTSTGHAVCVRRRVRKPQSPIWLLDSLNKQRRRVSSKLPPVGQYKIRPFVVILDNRYFLIPLPKSPSQSNPISEQANYRR